MFKLVNKEDGFNRVQVSLGPIKRSFTVRQFIIRVTDVLNRLGYEVKEKSKENDTVEFLNAFSEMCRAHENCVKCPIGKADIQCMAETLGDNAEDICEITGKWVCENKN